MTSTRPTGTVTLLFTDIEGSTERWERAPDAMRRALARHDEQLRRVFDDRRGYVFATGGDGFAVAFPTADAAVSAAADAQRRLRSEPWPADARLSVRMGLHTGRCDERDGDYFGPTVNRAARIMGAAHGGQVLASGLTAELVRTGSPPDVELIDAGRHVLKGLQRPEPLVEVRIDGTADFPQLRTATPRVGNLPASRTSLVGRADDLAALARDVGPGRLVTVVGPGGAGKTRLALAHADARADECGDGAWFIDLTTASSDDEVAPEVLASLGFDGAPDGTDPGSTLVDHVEDWHALLVLDNCEHVIDGAADFVDQLLDRTSSVSVLATSREPLAVTGERVLPLGGLDDLDDAVGLFLHLARQRDPGFEVSDDDRTVIRSVCSGLDGLPLAIELAAARAPGTDLGDLGEALLRRGRDRRDRRRPDRHRSLVDVVRWSVDLLDDAERTVFARLAVFRGGFDRAGAIEVASGGSVARPDVDAALSSLVDRSLVVAKRTPTGLRYDLLVTIGAVARALLADSGEASAVRDRHLAWAVASSQTAFDPHREPRWFPVPVEVDNQRAALRHALDHERVGAAALLLVASTGSLAAVGAVAEARRFGRELSDVAGDDPTAAEHLPLVEMLVAEIEGDFTTSHTVAEAVRGKSEAGSPAWNLASLLVGHHQAALDPRAALATYDEIDRTLGVTPMSAYGRGEAALTDGRPGDAVDAILAAYGVGDVGALEAAIGPLPDVIVLSDLGVALHLDGSADEAEIVADLLAETIELSAVAYSAFVPLLRAVVRAEAGHSAEVIALLEDAATLERRWSPPVLAFDCVAAAAVVALAFGRDHAASRAYAAIHHGPSRTIGSYAWKSTVRRQIRRRLDDDTRAELTAEGRDVDPRAALDRLIDDLGRR